MLRKLVFALGAIAVTFAGSASAQSIIPQHVNLHNGYIELHSSVLVTIAGRTDNEPITVLLLRNSDTCCQDRADVYTNSPNVFNHCCIVAGTLYAVRALILGKTYSFPVRPLLCNVRGIPFGYQRITFTGHLYRANNNNWVGEVTPHVADVPCPVDAH
jgi:hypothetical protein